MNVRLIYNGPLKAQSQDSPRPREKQQIRLAMHPQLKRLWEQRRSALTIMPLGSTLTKIAADFNRCGYDFVPLVSSELRLVCTLDILLLRREEPGGVIQGGGDLDNRLKTLFDALCVSEKL
jgi:hypothetical protein